MPLEKVPKEHIDLLLHLKRTLTTDALEDMKLAVRADEFGGFQDAELEKIQNVREMLRELEVRGVIGVGKYMKLKDIMRSIGYVAVLEDIDQTQTNLFEKGYGTESAASNTEMTSKRVSQPHKSLDDSSEVSVETELKQFKHLKITKATRLDASSARLREVAAPAVAEPLNYAIESEASNTEMTSKRVPQPHQPLGDSSGEIASFMVTDGPLQAADKVVKILRNRYKTTGSFVHLIPWVGEDMKPISDIYTKLKRQYTGYRGKLLNSYDEIFLEKTVKPVKEGDSRPRIILKGRAGIGKSTLVDKMAYDWANDEKLQEYKLVFVLKMFALEESSEFIDAIFHQLMDEEVAISKDDLMSYITTNPAKVLILFDGFDEFKTTGVTEDSQPPNVSQILNGKLLRDSYVVVTTRHSHFHKLVSKSLIEKPFVYVKVLGFTEKDIEQYIRRFFSEERDRSEGLIQKIKSSDDLFDLATSPMLLLLMCLLWREQSTIPDTMYRLYKDALRYIFQRKQLPPHEESKVVVTIGKNALHDLLSPRQFLSFKEGDFEDNALRSALKAGILTSQRVIKGLDTQHSVSFIHRTFQEYCAAIFFQSLLGTDEEQFNSNLDRVGNIMKDGPQGLEYLLRFCCGGNQSFTKKVLSLIQKCCRERNLIVTELMIKCSFAGQFEDLH